ncbi:type II toxin-antitoxin system VapC family toxin [Synechococcus sp. CS-603]|uniref:type II toxin-antitoxin system VapC family toxin n=1 Tax=Synechococcus sp. CS-603 TaxID=2847981 RepID=UPI00223ACED0|nr:type II toxin-antitoxin system VapC family toxin [Synechococcus sp. CS-603]MCT0202154.1 type II toxin-antitoxin system VapC family toxin [Synechococcus sp. CS-603]
MQLLLDTHALLWWLAEPELLSAPVLAALVDPSQQVFVSAASAWEIATKHRLGRLPSADIVLQEGWTLLEAQGFVALPVTWRHGLRAGSYALAHRDPFDRLLAAQAELDGLTLVTDDPALASFPCRRLW